MSPVDTLLESLRVFSNLVLPTLGAAALIALIVLLCRLCTLVKEATLRVRELKPTIESVDQSIEKIQAPLDTVVNLAHSVDKAQESAEKAIINTEIPVSIQVKK